MQTKKQVKAKSPKKPQVPSKKPVTKKQAIKNQPPVKQKAGLIGRLKAAWKTLVA